MLIILYYVMCSSYVYEKYIANWFNIEKNLLSVVSFVKISSI